MDASWVVVLSDGTEVAEGSKDYEVIAGERTPWVRLCTFLVDNDLSLKEVKLSIDGVDVIMPAEFSRFGFDDYILNPTSFSLQYHAEGEISGNSFTQSRFVDLAAHYKDFAVHFIQEIEGTSSWIVVTSGLEPLAQTPPQKP